MENHVESASTRGTKRRMSCTAKVITGLFFFSTVASLAAVGTVMATRDVTVEKVPLQDWDNVKKSFARIFGDKEVVENDDYVEYKSGTYTHLRIGKDGKLSSHMPLHAFKLHEKDIELEFNGRDSSVTVLGKDVNYVYRKP